MTTRTPQDYALKDCPFCGCAATFVKHSAGIRGTQGYDQWDAVACKHCRATVGACDRRFRCREDAAAAWNRRAPQSGWISVDERLPASEKPVLLDIGKKFPIRAMWVAKHTVEAGNDDPDWGEYDEANDMHYCPEGWYEWNEHEEVHWRVSATPIRWTEIPLPTSTKGESTNG